MVIEKGIRESDREALRSLLESTGFFHQFEIETALELADETCLKGSEKSGYKWLRIEEEGNLVAFATYGKNPCSQHSWDLYWIAVSSNVRGTGYGTALLDGVEKDVRREGGRILWIDTSGRELYTPTISFYLKRGYELAASLKDFYADGDPKLIYRKEI